MDITKPRPMPAERIRVEVRSTKTTTLLDYVDLITAPSEQLTRRVMDILAHADITHGQRTYAILRDEKGKTIGTPFAHMFSYEDRSR